jgi:hypothetical protein
MPETSPVTHDPLSPPPHYGPTWGGGFALRAFCVVLVCIAAWAALSTGTFRTPEPLADVEVSSPQCTRADCQDAHGSGLASETLSAAPISPAPQTPSVTPAKAPAMPASTTPTATATSTATLTATSIESIPRPVLTVISGSGSSYGGNGFLVAVSKKAFHTSAVKLVRKKFDGGCGGGDVFFCTYPLSDCTSAQDMCPDAVMIAAMGEPSCDLWPESDISCSGLRYNYSNPLPWLRPDDPDLPKMIEQERDPRNVYVSPLLFHGILESDPFFYPEMVFASNFDRIVCQLDHHLYEPTDPDLWAARPGFATHLSSHAAYPRDEFADMMEGVAKRLMDLGIPAPNNTSTTERRVLYPGNFRKNVDDATVKRISEDVTTDINRDVRKLRWTRNFRFAFQPESRRTKCGSYQTEKLPGLLMAGVVPIYWGDPVDYAIFNRKRILVLDEQDGSGDTLEEIAEKVFRLESDAEYRRAFFAVPLLAEGATERVAGFCDKIAQAVRTVARRKPAVSARMVLFEVAST